MPKQHCVYCEVIVNGSDLCSICEDSYLRGHDDYVSGEKYSYPQWATISAYANGWMRARVEDIERTEEFGGCSRDLD